MKRSEFLNLIKLGGSCLAVHPILIRSMCNYCSIDKAKKIGLIMGEYGSGKLPKNKKVTFGWEAVEITPADFLHLKLTKELPYSNLLFRVSIAQEMHDEKVLHVYVAEKHRYIGSIEIKFSSILVPYELYIDKRFIDDINEYGLEIKLEANQSLHIFSNTINNSDDNLFLPHILVCKGRHGAWDEFLETFMSTNSIQSFGWREGVVLDGLWQLYHKKNESKALETIHKHFELFFDENQNLVYDNFRSETKINEINSIEATLPFATLAKVNNTHPVFSIVNKAWEGFTKANGMVTDGSLVSAEGCYTVAYPMAVLGKKRNDKVLIENALGQLVHRFVLLKDNSIYLRYNQGEYSFRNWARGACWFLLGFARTISELKDELEIIDVVDKFREGIDLSIKMQRKDGLWSCFMHKEVLPDTSGSAGIAAAILIGVNEGFLPGKYKYAAKKCWDGLQKYLTPDGLLKGVAQDNRGGVELQESNYRVIAQMGMGLMAQLYAEL